MIPPSWYMLLVMVIVGSSIFHLTWLVAFSSTVLIIFGLARLWNHYALRGVLYRRTLRYRRGFPGETLDVGITTENRKILPLSWLRVIDHWPKSVGPEDESILAPSHIPDQGFLVNLYHLRWYQKAVRSYRLRLRERGVYQLGPLTIESGDLFGLYHTTSEKEQIDTITVFPELINFKALQLPTDDPFGDRSSHRRLFEDPTLALGIRPYHPEDDLRRIHWPATARTGSLQVKVYQPVSTQVMAIYLNVATMEFHWLGTAPALMEQLIRTCATVAVQGMQAGYAVGLYSNGCLAHADQPFRIAPGRSRQQLAILLQALAGVTSYVTGTFEAFLLKSMGQIPYGSTVIILSAIITPELVNVLLRLKKYRPHITLISLQQSPPPDIPGVACMHLPFQERPVRA